MRILRVYQSGRDPAHRARDRALAALGHEVRLVVPASWPEPGSESVLSPEPFEVVELEVRRAGDVNRHSHADTDAVRRALDWEPDVLDLHQEPFAQVTRQWLRAAPPGLPVALYTAQNVDKRFPPPFAQWERAALRRASGVYPCSDQAASVIRGKGFSGAVEVLPLGYDDGLFAPGMQRVDDDEIVLGLVGRLVPEKGLLDAVRVLARVHATRSTRLLVLGDGPEAVSARRLAADLGVGDRLEIAPWASAAELARQFRAMHVVLVPSRSTTRWVEQFGRVIVEAQASGCAVAGYATGAIPEVAGPAAMLVEEGDVEGLAQCVTGLVADPVEYDRRRRAGADRCRDRTWSAVARRHAALLASLLEAASPALTGRPAARREFGPTATLAGQERPFALPVLREGGGAVRLLARVLDRRRETLDPPTRGVR